MDRTGSVGDVSRSVCVVFVALIGSWIATQANADPSNPPSESFRSTVDFGFDMEMEERDTTVRGSIRSRSAKDEFASAAFRLGWQGLGTPLREDWGRPRPFFRAGLKWTRVGTKTDIGNRVPEEPGRTLGLAVNLAIEGMEEAQRRLQRRTAFRSIDPDATSAVQMDYRDGPIPGLYAGAGFAFEVPFPGDDFPGWFTIKPSLEWSMRRYTIKGGFTQVDITDVDPDETPNVIEVLKQDDTFSFWQHRLGPSLELEAGLRDFERFALSIFVAGRAQFLVSRAIHTWGSPSGLSYIEYDRIPEPTSPPTNLSTSDTEVRFRTQSHSVVVSVGGGIRLHWF